MNYLDFLVKHGYSKELVDIYRGDIEVPKYTFLAPPDLSFGFPPVLIPLWSNPSWPGYIGVAKHWFGNCPDSYVQFYAADFTFVEVAKNLDQLKAWMTFDFLCNVPDSKEVGRFAESIGFCATCDLERVFSNCEVAQDLAGLAIFKDNLPMILEKDDVGSPSWLVESSDVKNVKNLILLGEYESAWYQLNSSVLSKVDVIDILNLLSLHASDKNAFQDMVACWRSGAL
jgi:hypothetical protein